MYKRQVETWWPEILNFLQLRVTNARTEGYNRTIKTIKRVGCGYRNGSNYRRRIMLHSAAAAAYQTTGEAEFTAYREEPTIRVSPEPAVYRRRRGLGATRT